MNIHKPLVLCILDGWGISKSKDHNAIFDANPKFYNYLVENYPNSQLKTSGESVGLPSGQMGNSEVGHMTIGSGRIVLQDLLKISQNLASDEFLDKNKLIQNLISKLKDSNNSCHIIGLASSGGVHSHIDHAIKLAKYLLNANVKVNFHMICDGRDTSPKSAINELEKLSSILKNKNFCLSTISGRYYTMDRDRRYDRTRQAYEAIVFGKGDSFSDPEEVITRSYEHKITDEFILPCVYTKYHGIDDNDALFFFNFRPDRMRQITNALIDKNFEEFENKKINFSAIITMTDYSSEISKLADVLFQKQNLNNTLGQILSKQGLKQLRISETEKYPHVTYFFNGGEEEKFNGEDRIMVPSPKVATYDLAPEMSAREITDRLIETAHNYDFILVNFANTDMIGHTGNYAATKEAVKVIDESLEKLYSAIIEKLNGTLVVTSDHGNAETMFDKQTQQPLTSHTLNPVPFILVNKFLTKHNISLKNGQLYDITPTILELFGINKTPEMEGKNLIIEKR